MKISDKRPWAEKSIRCTRCGSEFSEAEIEGFSDCPDCGSTGLPMYMADDVTIKINWHELRILGMWADNWAAQCEKNDPSSDAREAVAGILRRIAAQHPGKAALTLMGELMEAQEIFPEMEAVDGEGNVLLPSKKPS